MRQKPCIKGGDTFMPSAGKSEFKNDDQAWRQSQDASLVFAW
jgi:hypothetical protein